MGIGSFADAIMYQQGQEVVELIKLLYDSGCTEEEITVAIDEFRKGAGIS
jgi:hypothetical protein